MLTLPSSVKTTRRRLNVPTHFTPTTSPFFLIGRNAPAYPHSAHTASFPPGNRFFVFPCAIEHSSPRPTEYLFGRILRHAPHAHAFVVECDHLKRPRCRHPHSRRDN